jgi:hypothetical protein
VNEGARSTGVKEYDEAVIRSYLEHMLKIAVDKALAQLRAGQGAKLDRRTVVERELSLIAVKKHLVDAIADGNKDPAIRERLNPKRLGGRNLS